MVPPQITTLAPSSNAGGRLPPRGDSNISNSSTMTVPRPPPPPPVPPPLPPPQQQPTTREVSQLTVDTDDGGNSNNQMTTSSDPLPRPTSFGGETRDVSASSRDGLRRQMLLRRQSLTTQEQSYLAELCDNGNEVEVHLAMETLQDDQLFFDYTTPRHIKYQPPPSTTSGRGEEDEGDDATRQSPSPTSIKAFDRKALDRQLSVGSSRRHQRLIERRNSSVQRQMWLAHQGGIAVTTNSSRRSITLRRESSIGSSIGGSGLRTSEVFRSPPRSSSVRGTSPAPPLPTSARRQTPATKPIYRRSQSMVSYPPPMPPGERLRTESTSSSRKSVTFSGLQQGEGTSSSITSSGSSRRRTNKKTLQRSVSDGIQYAIAKVQEEDAEEQRRKKIMERQESASSIPSLHHPNPVRSESMSSVPSLHHPNPVRGESISSIPSLHHPNPVRGESISSIPSIHHPHPVRSESVHSIPSLHHGRPIRSESFPIRTNSVTSFPSLHHGNSICSNSIVTSNSVVSIPSLHHGHSLHDDASSSYHNSPDRVRRRSSIDSMPQDANLILAHNQRYYYSASDDIASKWLQQEETTGEGTTTSATVSLPDSVTIPFSETHTTEAETDVVSSETPVDEDDDDTPPQGNSASTSPRSSTSGSPGKPVLLRLASRNNYQGEGVEVTELASDPRSLFASQRQFSMLSMDASIRTASSWDESSRCFSTSEIFRNIHRSLSDDDMANLYLGSAAAQVILRDTSSHRRKFCEQKYNEDDLDETSWDMNSDSDGRFDSWNILKDDYINGYGGGGTLGFSILGTGAEDESAQPHVLSPPLMESLQSFMPFSKSGENFHLKYSMVRDGASLHSFLKRVRGIEYSILAVETLDGEVFGAFTSQPWRKNWNYFGTGESFLWRMRRTRLEKTAGILEQAQLESEIDVYPYTGENKFIQLCTHDRIAVGGGNPSSAGEKKSEDDPVQSYDWGFGLAIEHDFLQGSSSPCITFGSPSLSNVHSDGSTFEIVNIELWTLTPCLTVEEAEKLELGKLFLERKK